MAVVSIVWQAWAMSDVGLWVQPDSVAYLALADHLLHGGGPGHELFAARTPGYPLLLTAVMALGGAWRSALLLAVQHAMVVCCALAAGALTARLTGSRWAGLTCGVLTGCSWALTGYAGTVLTEVPYACAVLCSVYLLCRFAMSGSLGALTLASAALGAAALIRPAGLPLIGVLLMAVAVKRPRPAGGAARVGGRRSGWRAGFIVPAAGLGPFLFLAGGWALVTRIEFGASGARSFGGRSLYHRVVTREGWTTPANAAMQEIQECVRRVNAEDPSAPPFEARVEEHAVICLQRAGGCSLAEASSRLGQAASPIARTHLPEFLAGTVRNAAYLMILPDQIHLFRSDAEAARLAGTAVDVGWRSTDSFRQDVRRRLHEAGGGDAWMSVPGHGALGRVRSAWARAFDRGVLHGDRLAILPGDTLFENWCWLCAAGAVAGLLGRNRRAWAMVAGVIALQILPCAFAPGVDPRFTAPIRPLIHACGIQFMAAVLSFLLHRAGLVNRSAAPIAGVNTPAA